MIAICLGMWMGIEKRWLRRIESRWCKRYTGGMFGKGGGGSKGTSHASPAEEGTRREGLKGVLSRRTRSYGYGSCFFCCFWTLLVTRTPPHVQHTRSMHAWGLKRAGRRRASAPKQASWCFDTTHDLQAAHCSLFRP